MMLIYWKKIKENVRRPDVKEPFAALAFKIATDPYVGRLAFFRAYSGRLDAGSYMFEYTFWKQRKNFSYLPNAC